MVMRHTPVIPRHVPSLNAGDYAAYARPRRPGRADQAEALEALWRSRLGPCRIVPTPTGRQALWEFLDRAGLQDGDEVLVAAYNFYVIVRILLQRQLVPVFVDIEPDTLCMDPADLARKVTTRSRLVLVTHLFGNPADLARITAVCRPHGLLLFEDCAHAVGTMCGGAHAGSRSDGALFSFGIYKIVNTFGGGMLALPQGSRAAGQGGARPPAARGPAAFLDTFVRCAVSWLLRPRWHTAILYPVMKFAERFLPGLHRLVYPSGNDPAYRFRLGDRAPFQPFMTAMMARQLGRLERQIERRRDIAARLKTLLVDVPQVRPLNEDRHGRSNLSYLGCYVPDPEASAAYLEREGLLANPHEYYECSSLPQFSEHATPCERAAYAAKHLLRLPNSPAMSDVDVSRLAAALRASVNARALAAQGDKTLDETKQLR